MFLSADDVTKDKYFLQYLQQQKFLQIIFLNIKQNSDMEFPIILVNVSLCVVDGDEFLETQSTWIWIIHSMPFHVSL